MLGFSKYTVFRDQTHCVDPFKHTGVSVNTWKLLYHCRMNHVLSIFVNQIENVKAEEKKNISGHGAQWYLAGLKNNKGKDVAIRFLRDALQASTCMSHTNPLHGLSNSPAASLTHLSTAWHLMMCIFFHEAFKNLFYNGPNPERCWALAQ